MNKSIQHLIAIALLGYIFFFHGIGSYSVKEPDEGRYAEIPREMVETGDWVVPHLNYVRYFEKPVLSYWIVAASYKIFGVNEWAFRFTNALAAFICVLLAYCYVRKWLGGQIAFLSSVILTSSFGFFGIARVVTTDMFLTLWLFLALLSFYGYYRERRSHILYISYASLALATLVKGPVAIVLFGITVLIFLALERDLLFLKELKWLKGVSLYLIITLPWFVAVCLREREFFYFFFIDQNILRFLTTKHNRVGSIFFFFPVVFAGMFPWSLFIPRALISLWGKKEIRLFIIWSLVVLTFFSISKSKLPPYILPAFPSLAIVLACLFQENWSRQFARRWEALALICLLLSGAIALTFPWWKTGFLQPLISTSPEIPGIMQALKPFCTGVIAIWTISAILLFLKPFRVTSVHFMLLAVSSLAFVTMLVLNLQVADRLNTTKRLALIINAHMEDADYLVDYGSFERSLPYYTKKRVILASYRGELAMGSRYQDAREFFLSEDAFLNLFKSDKHVFVVLKTNRLKKLRERGITNIHILGQQNERYLIFNQPYVIKFTK